MSQVSHFAELIAREEETSLACRSPWIIVPESAEDFGILLEVVPLGSRSTSEESMSRKLKGENEVTVE